ncbi:MAG: fasciclin domain-containing protein [Paludibacteraceae bacterium]|nr:fasciclin domain-containing protein [Paludibacteraceae bacterium]
MKRFKPFVICALVLYALSCVSCSMFGLSYAYSFRNESGAEFAGLTCDAYEFIRQHSTDEFALMYQAINRAGMEEYYHDSIYTFFIIKDAVWDKFLTDYHYSSINEVPVKTLRTYLMRSIIKGKYLSSDIDGPIFVTTLDETVTMRLYKTIVAPTSSQNLNSLRAGWTNANGKINQVGCTTSNLECTNGVIHVMSARFTFLS